MLTLYDAARCPYCARARIVLAEKGVSYEPVAIDLSDRPAWLYEKNPLGRVPVLEEGDFVLPESLAIMEYLEERYPAPQLLPGDPRARALVRARIVRFDQLSSPYYALRRGDESARAQFEEAIGELDATLAESPYLCGREYGLADVAYVPWLLRARSQLGVDLDAYESVSDWIGRLSERPAIARELELAVV